jgi:hypothetical protein
MVNRISGKRNARTALCPCHGPDRLTFGVFSGKSRPTIRSLRVLDSANKVEITLDIA